MKRTGNRGRSATAKRAAGKREAVVTDEERKPSLAESVYLGIKQDIFDFRLLPGDRFTVGSSRVDLQACKLEYSIVSPK